MTKKTIEEEWKDGKCVHLDAHWRNFAPYGFSSYDMFEFAQNVNHRSNLALREKIDRLPITKVPILRNGRELVRYQELIDKKDVLEFLEGLESE